MVVRRTLCPSCGRGFNCDGSADCWCLKVERLFDYEAMIVGTGAMGCVCPVCLTGGPGTPDTATAGT